MIDGTLSVLKSAAKERVQRFVLTSSANAAMSSRPNHPVFITADTWNEEGVQLAFNLPQELSEVERGLAVYGASKVKGEQALWKWVEENQPRMVVNSGKFSSKVYRRLIILIAK